MSANPSNSSTEPLLVPSRQRRRWIPLIVGAPLFLQNFSATVLATALPAIAAGLSSDVLHLNLAITLYMMAIALGLPLAAWLSEKVGARNLFCAALLLFSLASALAAFSQTLWHLASARFLQGLGAAMMLPVGRLLLMRNIPREDIVKATVWYTVPPVIGSSIGPLCGGLIVTYLSWPWLFALNLPLALFALVAAIKVVPKDQPGKAPPLDLTSFSLLASALLAGLAGLSGSGKGLLGWPISLSLIGIGVLLSVLYLRHAKRSQHPVIDFSLLKFTTFRAAIFGGTAVRITQGATPFLLPLFFQLGLGLSALHTGLLMFCWALGSLITRPLLTWSIEQHGFKNMLISTTIIGSVMYASLALLPQLPPATGMFYLGVVTVLLFSGGSRGMLMVGLNTLGYSQIPQARMNHATALSAMNQQVANSIGVVITVLLLNAALSWRGVQEDSQLAASDFIFPLVALAIINGLGLYWFIRLESDAGDELRKAKTAPRDKATES